MSSIAWLYVIDRALSEEIAAAGDPDVADEILRIRGRALDDDLFPWSGNCMMDLMFFLEDRGIASIADGEIDVDDAFSALTFVFAAADRALLPRLDPGSFRPEELAESMAAFEFDAAEAVMAATDGLNAIRAGIEALGGDDLLVITVG